MTAVLPPPLIIISGPPAAGKSTLAHPLAEALQLPLLAKDTLKEAIADAIGPAALRIEPALDALAFQTLYRCAAELLKTGTGCVMEAFFPAGEAEAHLLPLTSQGHTALIHVDAAPEILFDRYFDPHRIRDRHPIHLDTHRHDEREESIRRSAADPRRGVLALNIPTICIDTSTVPADPTSIAASIQALLTGHTVP